MVGGWLRGAALAGAILAAPALAAPLGAHAADAPVKKCVMYQTGDLKVRLVGNRALLDGAVNGQPVRVLIDTGAARSILFRSKAQALRIPLTDAPGYRMGGVGGVTRVSLGYIDNLQLTGAGENAGLKGVRMLVAGERGQGDVDMILGEDVLGRFDLEFDLKHGAVRLLQPRNCGEQDMAYWAQSYDEAPIVMDASDTVRVNVKLNGRTVRAELDSGAATSVGTPRAAQLAQVPLTPVEGASTGIGAGRVSTSVGVLDTFQIGGETIRQARLRFADLFGATTFDTTGSHIAAHLADEPDMLLGFDFLKSHRVLIARERRKIYFTYEGGPVFDVRRPPPPAGAAPAGPAPQAASDRAPAGS